MREPVEVDEPQDEVAAARVAAVDVAKASGVVCTRVPRDGEPGRFVTRVWLVDATTNAILELADHLTALEIEKVVLESTSDYWRPFFYLLEAAGLLVELVNARDVKNAPGRPKTDKLDAVWLAKLAGWEMLRPLKGVLGDAAAAAGKTSTFLGERYRRLARRRGKLKALVAIARTILIIIWHLLADRAARYDDLGDNYYITTINTDRKLRSHIRQIEALGYAVALTPAA
jgi:hypothetical protein